GAGFDPAALLGTLAAHAPAGLPVILGAGFEDATDLMASIAARHPLKGAAPDAVRRLKDPRALAELLATLRIPHPALTDGEGPGTVWKRAGASGGGHIRFGRRPRGAGVYGQRRIEGRAVSALFLAAGGCAHIVGFSEQWSDPTPAAPCRYGGAVGPIALPAPLGATIAAALDRLVAATGLVGLASADIILPADDETAFTLLEVNPRPGATLDVFDRGDGPSLLARHLAACDDRLSSATPSQLDAHAAAVVYAPRRCSLARLRRPAWTADWPAEDDATPKGAPLCTVFASARTPEAARALVARRRAALLDALSARRDGVRFTDDALEPMVTE
ncbi:ATP-grasp domain-containing protein, partial [Methylopila musalis]